VVNFSAIAVVNFSIDEHNGGFGQLGAQVIACAVVVVWAFGFGTLLFRIQDRLTPGGIRSTAEDELAGLDVTEMGVLAYPDFSGASAQGANPAEASAGREL
jgi:Amt family ammonium transporter